MSEVVWLSLYRNTDNKGTVKSVTQEVITNLVRCRTQVAAIQEENKYLKKHTFLTKRSKTKAEKYRSSCDLDDTIKLMQESVLMLVEENKQLRQDKEQLNLRSEVKTKTVDFLMAENNTDF